MTSSDNGITDERLRELEALKQRDGYYGEAAKAYAALAKIITTYDAYRGRGVLPAPVEYQQVVETINEARKIMAPQFRDAKAESAASEHPAPLPQQSPGAEEKDGWIEWKGGECPVDRSATVDIKMRGGSSLCDASAATIRWAHSGSVGDIIAYRLVAPPPSLSDQTDWRLVTLNAGEIYDALNLVYEGTETLRGGQVAVFCAATAISVAIQRAAEKKVKPKHKPNCAVLNTGHGDTDRDCDCGAL